MNYLECSTISPFSKTFVYFDKEPYYLIRIFEKNNIKVKMEPMEMNELKYHVIFAKIAKKDTEVFKKSMEELNRKMLLCGDPDYNIVCNQAITEIFKYIANENEKQLKK